MRYFVITILLAWLLGWPVGLVVGTIIFFETSPSVVSVWPHENHELPKLGGQFAVICDHECVGDACCLRIEE